MTETRHAYHHVDYLATHFAVVVLPCIYRGYNHFLLAAERLRGLTPNPGLTPVSSPKGEGNYQGEEGQKTMAKLIF